MIDIIGTAFFQAPCRLQRLLFGGYRVGYTCPGGWTDATEELGTTWASVGLFGDASDRILREGANT